VLAVVLALASATGCSGFDGAGDIAPGDIAPGDMMAAGALGTTVSQSAADWSCLGAPPAAPPSVTGAGNVRYSVLLRSLLGVPLNNVVARACQAADLSCATPVGTGQGLNGEFLSVDVPLGFAGFLEIQADGHMPTMDTQPLQPIPTAAVGQLTQALNVEAVPELAILSVAVVDCREQRAPGASFSNNLGGRSFYFADGVPNVEASATDISGLGGFINVPVRLVEVTAELEADGRLIGTRNVLPRASWLTVVQVRPPAAPFD
jgi:hypothetical protein